MTFEVTKTLVPHGSCLAEQSERARGGGERAKGAVGVGERGRG